MIGLLVVAARDISLGGDGIQADPAVKDKGDPSYMVAAKGDLGEIRTISDNLPTVWFFPREAASVVGWNKIAVEPTFRPPTESKLADKFAAAINYHSAENGSNTPDFILGNMLVAMLDAFDAAVTARDKWWKPEEKMSRAAQAAAIVRENHDEALERLVDIAMRFITTDIDEGQAASRLVEILKAGGFIEHAPDPAAEERVREAFFAGEPPDLGDMLKGMPMSRLDVLRAEREADEALHQQETRELEAAMEQDRRNRFRVFKADDKGGKAYIDISTVIAVSAVAVPLGAGNAYIHLRGGAVVYVLDTVEEVMAQVMGAKTP